MSRCLTQSLLPSMRSQGYWFGDKYWKPLFLFTRLNLIIYFRDYKGFTFWVIKNDITHHQHLISGRGVMPIIKTIPTILQIGYNYTIYHSHYGPLLPAIYPIVNTLVLVIHLKHSTSCAIRILKCPVVSIVNILENGFINCSWPGRWSRTTARSPLFGVYPDNFIVFLQLNTHQWIYPNTEQPCLVILWFSHYLGYILLYYLQTI